MSSKQNERRLSDEEKNLLEGVLFYITSNRNERLDFKENPSKSHVLYQACQLEESLLGIDIDWDDLNQHLDEE